jgi:AcrR family transcriptional regulator
MAREAPRYAPVTPPAIRSDRHDEILEAAISLFSRKGFAAASVQDVADAVGLLKGSLYHYIDSKDDLLFRILDESHRQGTAIMDEIAALDVPPSGRSMPTSSATWRGTCTTSNASASTSGSGGIWKALGASS